MTGTRAYRGRTFVRDTAYICGDYLEGQIYTMFQQPGVRRNKSKPCSEIQAKINERNSLNTLKRIVRLNFTEQDIALHLTYGRESLDLTDENQVRSNLDRFMRRLRRLYKKAGVALKYISVTEKGKKRARPHHHLIISGGVDRDEIEKLWGHGYANTRRLRFGEDGCAGLARYIAKGRCGYRRWNASRNLAHPEPVQHDGAFTVGEHEDIAEAIEKGCAHDFFESMYPEFELIDATCVRNAFNRGVYIYYEMRRRE